MSTGKHAVQTVCRNIRVTVDTVSQTYLMQEKVDCHKLQFLIQSNQRLVLALKCHNGTHSTGFSEPDRFPGIILYFCDQRIQAVEQGNAGSAGSVMPCSVPYCFLSIISSLLFSFRECCIELLAISKPSMTSSTSQTTIRIRTPPLGMYTDIPHRQVI